MKTLQAPDESEEVINFDKSLKVYYTFLTLFLFLVLNLDICMTKCWVVCLSGVFVGAQRAGFAASLCRWLLLVRVLTDRREENVGVLNDCYSGLSCRSFSQLPPVYDSRAVENTREYICRAMVTVVDHLGNISANLDIRLTSFDRFAEAELRIHSLKQVSSVHYSRLNTRSGSELIFSLFFCSYRNFYHVKIMLAS